MKSLLPAILLSLAVNAPAKDDFPRLNLTMLLGGNAREVSLIRIEPGGRLFFDVEGRPQSLALDEISRIVPRDQPKPIPDQEARAPQQFYLAAGGRLAGALLDGGKDRVLRIDVGLPQPMDVPIESLAAIRFSPREQPDAQREFETRLADRPVDKDLLVVAQADKTVVLPGALESVTPREWEFKLGKKAQKASLAAAYAVILGGSKSAHVNERALIRFAPENELAGHIASADVKGLTADAGTMGSVAIPWTAIQEIDLRSDRLVYLSDLAPITQQSHSVLDTGFPLRLNRNVEGGRLSMRSRVYEKGLGVHAYSSLTYKLGGQFERFVATVGIDDAAGEHGSVVFHVLLDGKPAFESAVLRGTDAPVSVSVDVSSAAMLTLECDDANDLDLADHADWADAALIRAKTSAVR